MLLCNEFIDFVEDMVEEADVVLSVSKAGFSQGKKDELRLYLPIVPSDHWLPLSDSTSRVTSGEMDILVV